MANLKKLESAIGKYREGHFKEAFQLFIECEKHAESKFYIGLSFEKGNGVEENCSEAVRWYNKAAINGHPAAMYRLGLCYENGTGIPKNLRMAKHWYELGAKAGNPGAAGHLENLPPIPNDSTPEDDPSKQPSEDQNIPPVVSEKSKQDFAEKQKEPSNTNTDNPEQIGKPSIKDKDKSYYGTPLLNRKNGQKEKKGQPFGNSKSEKKINKFAIFILSFIGIIILGGIIAYLWSDDSMQAPSQSNEILNMMTVQVSNHSEDPDNPKVDEGQNNPGRTEAIQHKSSEEEEKDASDKKAVEPKSQSDDELYASATSIEDYKKLADKGYKKAYATLAELYLKQRDYDNAHIWALKAGESNTDIEKACKVINMLTTMDYYHNGAHGGIPSFYQRYYK